MRRPGRPGITEEQAEHVRTTLRQVKEQRFGGNSTTTAKALGMTQSAVSQMLSRKNRPSYATAVALAALLDVEPADVLAGTVVAPVSGFADPYPERARALQRLAGIVPDAVIEALRSVEVHDSPLTELEWVELALRRTAEHKRASDIESRIRMKQ